MPRVLALVMLLCAVAACTTTVGTRDSVKSPPRNDQKSVIVSVTSNTRVMSAFDALIVRPVGADKQLLTIERNLSLVAHGVARDTGLFAGNLPAGRYELVAFMDYEKQATLAFKDATRARLGFFTVTQGKTVDLGRLVVMPVNDRFIVGRSTQLRSNRQLLERFAAAHARLLAGEVTVGWDVPLGAGDEVEQYALQRPLGADGVTELADGTVIAASRLGTLLKFEVHSKKLQAIDSGNLPAANLLFIAGNRDVGWYLAAQKKKNRSLCITHRNSSTANGSRCAPGTVLKSLPSGLVLAIIQHPNGSFFIESSHKEGTKWRREYSNLDSKAAAARP